MCIKKKKVLRIMKIKKPYNIDQSEDDKNNEIKSKEIANLNGEVQK